MIKRFHEKTVIGTTFLQQSYFLLVCEATAQFMIGTSCRSMQYLNISKGGNIIFSMENVYLYLSLGGVTEMHGQLLEHINADDITHLDASFQQVHKDLHQRCTDIDGAFSKFKQDKVPMPIYLPHLYTLLS